MREEVLKVYLNKNRSLKSTLIFAGLLMFAEHLFAIINAYFIHSVDIYSVYAFLILILFVPAIFSIFFIGLWSIPFNKYRFSEESKYFGIICKGVLCIALIIFINSVFFFLSLLGSPDIRDLLLANSKFGDNQLVSSSVPAVTSVAFVGMLWSSIAGNGRTMMIMVLAFALLEASTLSRSGFIAIIFSSLIYSYRVRLPLKRFIPALVVVLLFICAVGVAQGRFDPESMRKILVAPAISLSRYYAESFALPYSIADAVKHVPSAAVIFGFPIIKLYSFFGDEGSLYFYNEFRTEFFPVDIGGASDYSNVIHSFPSLLFATGGLPSFLIGLSLWLLVFLITLRRNPAIGFILFHIIFFRGLFGYNLMGWHNFFAIAIILIVTPRWSCTRRMAR